MWIFKVSKTESEFFITKRFDVFQENKRKLGCLHYLGILAVLLHLYRPLYLTS